MTTVARASRPLAVLLVLVIAAGLGATRAAAQSDASFPTLRGWGPRAGFSTGPEQKVHFGVHADLGELAPLLSVRPSLEVGIGRHLTLVELNFDALYQFRFTRRGPWTPHGGVGLGINSDMNIALSVVGGGVRPWAGHGDVVMEVRIGLANSPDLTLAVGLLFH
jgi:hypothetical protein